MPQQKELHYFDEKMRLDSRLWSKLFDDHPVNLRWRRQAKFRLKRYRKNPQWSEVR